MPSHRYVSTRGDGGRAPAEIDDQKASALDYAEKVGKKSIRNLHENKTEITGELAGLMRSKSANRSAIARTMDKHADATTVTRQKSMDKRQFLKGMLDDAETKNTESDRQ